MHGIHIYHFDIGDLMGVLCMRDGPEVYISMQHIVLGGVQTNLDRQTDELEEEAEKLSEKLGATRERVSFAV